ncbi:hypothetical protein KCU64_g90, partial [Aureobasidium melanogenum]
LANTSWRYSDRTSSQLGDLNLTSASQLCIHLRGRNAGCISANKQELIRLVPCRCIVESIQDVHLESREDDAKLDCRTVTLTSVVQDLASQRRVGTEMSILLSLSTFRSILLPLATASGSSQTMIPAPFPSVSFMPVIQFCSIWLLMPPSTKIPDDPSKQVGFMAEMKFFLSSTPSTFGSRNAPQQHSLTLFSSTWAPLVWRHRPTT